MKLKKIVKQIEKFIQQKNWNRLKNYIIKFRISEIAQILLELDEKKRILIFRMLPKKISTDVFSHLKWEYQHSLLKDINLEETKYILNNLKPDDRTDLLEELPGHLTKRFLNMLSEKELVEAKKLLGYPEESVGRLMTTEYIYIKPDWSIKDVITHIRKHASRSETINMIYVVDNKLKLLDSIKLGQIITTPENKKITDIMDYSYISLSVYDDREIAVSKMEKYDLYALPVLDSEGILVGIVTYDDVLDIVEEEITEDFYKSSGISPLKTGYSYASVFQLFSKRIVWLIMLVIVNFASSTVMAAYEKVIATSVSLIFFIPLLIGSGGNTGAQSSTLVIRAISTGEIKLKEWKEIIFKEIILGLLLGISLSILSLILAFFNNSLQTGYIVSLSMILVILIANLIGTVFPFIFIKFKLDPAVASSPIIASIVDATGLIIYFTIAVYLL
jgi:magnesium transporter